MRGLVVGLVVIFLCVTAASAEYECTRQPIGITEDFCTPSKGCQRYCWTGEGNATNVKAFKVFYNPVENDWNLTRAGVSCAQFDADKPYSWRSKYGWAAFCGPNGPQGKDACGKCVRVINREKDKGKDVYETVRIVEICSDVGFDLDNESVFTKLDFNGDSTRYGHLNVDYQFVDCEDENEHVYNGGENIQFTGI